MRDARRSWQFYRPAELHEQQRQAASAQEQPRQAVAWSELHLVLAKGDVVRSQEKGWKFREEGARFRNIWGRDSGTFGAEIWENRGVAPARPLDSWRRCS